MTDADKQVFLSYASQDFEAAHRIAAALRAGGIDVWLDQSELRGGDEWDHKIRQHIKTCALFIPIISANAMARTEGYFRLEWKLAIDRSNFMATGKAFILPVVIDAAIAPDAEVPEKFREYQWTQLPEGATPPAFVEHVRRLLYTPIRSTLNPTTNVGVRKSPRKAMWPVAAAAVVAGIAIATYLATAMRPAVVPYSAEDRRMTFAVLPFQVPADDPRGVTLSAANTEAITAALERNSRWARTATRAAVRDASTKHKQLRDVARELNVRFLIRGSVNESAQFHGISIDMVDGTSENVLGNQTLAIDGDALAPRSIDDIDEAIGFLIFSALQEEVRRAAPEPAERLDERDLTFRGYVYWGTHRGAESRDGYETAMRLMNMALAKAPNDILTLELVAQMNLCDCLDAWTSNVDEQVAIAAKMLDRLTALDPNTKRNVVRAKIAFLRGHNEEVLSLANRVLREDPDHSDALQLKAIALIRLGRAREGVSLLNSMESRNDAEQSGLSATAAAVRYVLKDYSEASRLAQDSVARSAPDELTSRSLGAVRLTLVAAEARLGHIERAKSVMADFTKSVPAATTISGIRKWIFPTAPLYGVESLFDGLRLAGVPD